MGKIYHFLIFPIFVPKFHVVPYRISRFDVHLYTFFICFSRDSPRQETRRATPTSSSCLCIFFILRREMYILRRKTCVRNVAYEVFAQRKSGYHSARTQNPVWSLCKTCTAAFLYMLQHFSILYPSVFSFSLYFCIGKKVERHHATTDSAPFVYGRHLSAPFLRA